MARDKNELERYRPFLRLRVRQLTLDRRMRARFDESDILQEAYCRATAGWEQFRGTTEAELYCWLQQILRTTYLDLVRLVHAEKHKSEVILGQMVQDSSACLGDFLSVNQSTPSENVARQEQLLRLVEAIDELPDEQKDVIILHYLLGEPIKEIARELGRPEGTIGYHLYLARRALKQRLEDQE